MVAVMMGGLDEGGGSLSVEVSGLRIHHLPRVGLGALNMTGRQSARPATL